jgi:hypothetical protein
MAILRCNNCNYLREVPNEHVGKTAKCPACDHPAPIHDTVTLVKKVFEKYQLLLAKYQELEQPNCLANRSRLFSQSSHSQPGQTA